MKDAKILTQIAEKEIEKEVIAGKIIHEPDLLPEIFAGLSADKASIKYGCDKVLRIISEKQPAILYPEVDFFISQLDSKNNFLKWGAIHILANLAAVDKNGKIDAVFEKYFAPITGPVLITAANIVSGAAKITLAKPHLTEKITRELLKVEKAQYQTDECRNIALGHVINSFDQFYEQIENKEPVIKLVKNQLANTRNGTRKKAEKFMKKHKI